jgi:pumilio RNA-binding family
MFSLHSISGTPPLHVMMKDPYANYVVQKLVEVADNSQREAIMARIRSQAPQLKRFTYGKHILAQLEKLTGQSARPQS